MLSSLFFFLIFMAFFAVPSCAPKGARLHESAGSSSNQAVAADAANAALCGAALAASAAAAWLLSRNAGAADASVPGHLEAATAAAAAKPSAVAQGTQPGKKGVRVGHVAHVQQELAAKKPATSKAAQEESSEDGWFEEEEEEEEEEEGGEEGAEGDSGRGKLWTKAVFPAGVYGPKNWETANVDAVLKDWRCHPTPTPTPRPTPTPTPRCPCSDRNCLTKEKERLGSEAVVILYEHRKHFVLVLAKKMGKGGRRDAFRKIMEEHYDKRTKTFTRSFRIGDLGDCCEAAAGLAAGLSFATFATVRADVTLERPWHAGRALASTANDSYERGHLKAYIRSLMRTMEGTKGGKPGEDKWHTSYMPQQQRWAEYVKLRTDAGLPPIGKFTLFKKLWKESQIEEEKACGHPTCDVCGSLAVDRVKWEGNDEKLREIERKQVSITPHLPASPRISPHLPASPRSHLVTLGHTCTCAGRSRYRAPGGAGICRGFLVCC